MRATVIQMQSGNDKAQNLEQAQTLIESAVRDDHPDLLMLPEVFVLQGAGREERLANAENLSDGDEGRAGGPAYSLLQELARRHEVIIHGGSLFETAPDEGKVYNTTLVFGRDGNELARYRKIHLFDMTTHDGQE